jgi:hypothetical protein
MSEFIKIGELANVFNTLASKTKPSIGAISNSTLSTVKKSGNGLTIVLGIAVVGILGYELYLYFDRKRKEEFSK